MNDMVPQPLGTEKTLTIQECIETGLRMGELREIDVPDRVRTLEVIGHTWGWIDGGLQRVCVLATDEKMEGWVIHNTTKKTLKMATKRDLVDFRPSD